MCIRETTFDHLNAHGLPDGVDESDPNTGIADALLEAGLEIQSDDPRKTVARYVGEWIDSTDPTSSSAEADEPEAPDHKGLDDWSEVDRSQLERVPSSQPDCYAAWMDHDREQYIFDLPASHSAGLDDIPFAEVQSMVWQYTHAGLGKTQDQVAHFCNNELSRDMTRSYLRDMFKALDVTKTSPPYAYHLVASKEPAELDQQHRERLESEVMAETHRDGARKWRKEAESAWEELANTERFIDDLIERVDTEPPVIDGDFPSRDNVAERMRPRSVASLESDWHLGKEVNLHSNRFDADIARDRVLQSTRRTIEAYQMDQRPIDEFVICYLGDIIDGPHGDMHPAQWVGQDVHHLEQLDVASTLVALQIEMYGEFFGDDVTLRVEAIGGNHGRGKQNYDEDPYRLPELAMYALAREKAPDDHIDNWRIHDDTERAAHIRIGDTHTVLTHGDRAPRDMASLGDVPHADQSLVVSGHGHEYELRQCQDGETMVVQNGCLCGVTEFDRDQIGRHITPMQVTVEIGPAGPQPGKVIHCGGQR